MAIISAQTPATAPRDLRLTRVKKQFRRLEDVKTVVLDMEWQDPEWRSGDLEGFDMDVKVLGLDEDMEDILFKKTHRIKLEDCQPKRTSVDSKNRKYRFTDFPLVGNGAISEIPACTVEVALSACTSGGNGDAVIQQISWDSSFVQLMDQPHEFPQKLFAHKGVDLWGRFEKKLNQVGSEFSVLLLGRQHAGKSSLGNTLMRFCQRDSLEEDRFVSAPPGPRETSREFKSVVFPCPNSPEKKLKVVDSPAFHAIQEGDCDLLAVLGDEGIYDGRRRGENAAVAGREAYKAHGAILVVSLQQIQDDEENTFEYLATAQEIFRNLPNLSEFPYVIALTGRDTFLEGSQAELPLQELKNIMNRVKGAAGGNVYCISNVPCDGEWSSTTAKEIAKMLTQLATLSSSRVGFSAA